MSHDHTVIEPAVGLTVLVGPNNCGKSAIVAALQILCHNDNSTYVTRHNQKECSVTVETDDGHVVEWRRKNNSPRYTVDGQLFDRLGRGCVPDGLHDILRLPKIAAEGNQEFDVHFGEQKSPVFLLDKPGSHAAQFFASSSDAASLVEMQKRHQKKMLAARAEQRQLEAREEKLAADLVILAAADAIDFSVGQIEAQHEALGRAASSIVELTNRVRAIAEASTALDYRAAEATVFAAMTPPPALDDPQPLGEAICQLTRTRRYLDEQSARAVSLSSLPALPDIADEKPLAKIIGDLQAAHLASRRLDGQCVATRELSSPPALSEVEALRSIAEQIIALGDEVAAAETSLRALGSLTAPPLFADEAVLRQEVRVLMRATSELGRANAVHDELRSLAAAPEVADADEIQKMIRELSTALAAEALHAKHAEQADTQLMECEHLLKTWAEKQQLCPTCGGPLDSSRLVSHCGAVAGTMGGATRA